MKTLFHNADIYTGEGFIKGFLCENGYISKTFKEEIPLIPDTEYIDLLGHFVCLGFNDSHMHLLNYGQSLLQARLDEHTSSLKEMLDYLKDYIGKRKIREGQWISGRGWNQDYFEDVKRMPHKSDLDAISADHPMRLTRACGHCCLVNSKALEIAGINEKTPSPSGGAIDFENGLLYDNAIDLIEPFIPLPDKEEIKEMIYEGSKALNAFGITSCQSDDYCVFRQIPYEVIKEAYQELIKEGKLSVRVFEQSNFNDINEFKRFLKDGNRTGKGDLFFKTGPLKLLGDGSLGSRTAHLTKPYADDPSTCGFSLFSDEQFNEFISLANENGMSVAVHAIGDECLDKVLNAIENALNKNPRNDHRHGIVHCQISRKDQLERMIRLKTHIYAQTIFLDYDNHIVEQRVGKDLASTSYSWKTLKDHGLSVSNGSDAPVEIPDALKGIQCAVTRTSIDGCGPYLPDQAFSVEEAIESFTLSSAKASFEENFKGLIKEGYLADFIVLNENLFDIDPTQIRNVRVLSTWLGANNVFKRI